VQVELFADRAGEEKTFRQVLERGEPLAGVTVSYVYYGIVPADRPLSNYTPRILPRHALVSVPLEENYILWYR
jgi:starch phosphorylase